MKKKKILIIYGTAGGNTELVAEKVAEVLKKDKHQPCLQRVEESKVTDIKKFDLTILACPTYDQGVLLPIYAPFAHQLQEADLKEEKFAVISLGDPKYTPYYHLESAKILDEIVKKSGGQIVCPPLMISGPPFKFLDGLVKKWAENLAKQ